MSIQYTINRFWETAVNVNVFYSSIDMLSRVLAKVGIVFKKMIVCVKVRNIRDAVIVRAYSSDIDVFNQIFIRNEYKCLDDIQNPRLIVDLGANTGYSSIYFLNKFPDSHVIAIEPDYDNFNICKQNLRSYGNRQTTLKAAVWSGDEDLIFLANNNTDGRNFWGVQVRACRANEIAEVRGINIGSILKMTDYQEIDLLKIDIERSEI